MFMPREKIYDGETIFKTWCGWGAAATGTRLREYAKANFGGTSQMGAEYAMWKWAFNNPEESFPIWKEWHFEKYPDREQPTFEDFTKILLRKARANQNVGGSQKKINRFCAKYGLEYETRIKKEDVVQVVRRNHPLFQALLIVDKVEGKEIDAFLIGEDGTRSVHTLNVNEVGVIDKSIFGRKQGVVTKGNISRIPILEGLARDLWTPLKRIEVDERDIQKRYRFVYRNGSTGEDAVVYFDLDEGVDEEIVRLRKLKESVSEPDEATV